MASLAVLRTVFDSFSTEYTKTSVRLKVLDAFSFCCLLTAGVQFLYALLVGSFPFNAFLAGFFCCLSAFVLTVSLRMQIGPDGSSTGGKTPERAFAEYAFAMCTMFFAVWNYIG